MVGSGGRYVFPDYAYPACCANPPTLEGLEAHRQRSERPVAEQPPGVRAAQKKRRSRENVTAPPSCSLAPERPTGRSGAQYKSHREALAVAVDPETASSASLLLQPRREGCIDFPQNQC